MDSATLARKRAEYVARLHEAKDELVRRLAALTEVRRVSLVGSFSRGRADLFTDLDVVVVLETEEPFVERTARLYEFLALPVDLDLFCYTPAEFARIRRTPFGRNLLKDEVVLYEKAS